jgi:hypothetical protein
MLETQSASTFEPTSEPSATQRKTALRPVPESLGEVAATPCKGSTNSHPSIWEPSEPQFTKAIAEYYGVSRKSGMATIRVIRYHEGTKTFA